MNDSEGMLSAFSQMYFYKELVQDSLCFTPNDGTERELADLLLNLGDIIIAIQLKERNVVEQTTDQETELRWLNNKCKIAKKQIKDTMGYISTGQLPEFQNARGKKVVIDPDAQVVPLVVFMNSEIKHYPHILEKHSEKGISVNCLSFTDFQKMCRVLVTPIEIVSYLEYRKIFYEKSRQVDLLIYTDKHDDVLLSKPMQEETLVYQFIASIYGVQKVSENEDYLSGFQDILHVIPEHTVAESEENANYLILLFLAHFCRIEVKAFFERVLLAKKMSQNGQYNIIGSLRKVDSEYVIFIVAAKPRCMMSMEYLLQLARQKADVKKLLQVAVYWENNEYFHIDFVLLDNTQKIADDDSGKAVK